MDQGKKPVQLSMKFISVAPWTVPIWKFYRFVVLLISVDFVGGSPKTRFIEMCLFIQVNTNEILCRELNENMCLIASGFSHINKNNVLMTIEWNKKQISP